MNSESDAHPADDNSEWSEKVARLRHRVAELPDLLVAFSGGVDSSALLAVAAEVWGERVLAVTGVSPALSEFQKRQAHRVGRFLGVRHEWVETSEIDNEAYASNPVNRCYFCKGELYGLLRRRYGDARPHVADGTNASDLTDHRPGRQAALEHRVESPLAAAGMTKDDIRRISRVYGLETAEAPASPCLASRLPYGRRVTADRLQRIERGEDALRAAGLVEFRVRDLGDIARVEVAQAEWATAHDRRDAIAKALIAEGFREAVLDERPLRSGRLDAEGVSLEG